MSFQVYRLSHQSKRLYLQVWFIFTSLGNISCVVGGDLVWFVFVGFLLGRSIKKAKIYAGKHQCAVKKGSHLVLTLARAPRKIEKEKQ